MAWIEPALKVLGAAKFMWRRLGWLRRLLRRRERSTRRHETQSVHVRAGDIDVSVTVGSYRQGALGGRSKRRR